MSSHIELHPSLDIKQGVALVGFRYRTGPQQDNVVSLVATDETKYLRAWLFGRANAHGRVP